MVPSIRAKEVMEYLAVKSLAKEGLLKYNSYHPSFGYVGLSSTYGGDFQYYLHLELRESLEGGDSFIFAKEGFTINGCYLNELYSNHPIITKRWPYIFDKVKDVKTVKEMKRDYFFDYKEKRWN